MKKTNTKIKPANKTTGVLIRDFSGSYFFRVYDKKDKSIFKDYKLRHQDLQVVIDDSDCAFYEEDSENPTLDYAPETLGIKPKTNSKLPT